MGAELDPARENRAARARLGQVGGTAGEPSRGNLELDVPILLEGDEPISCGELAAGKATDEFVLGADP